MIEDREQVERLITRFLDGECDAAERRALNARLATDADARAQFEELSTLDREFGHVLRRELRHALPAPPVARRRPALWKISKWVVGGMAACLAVFGWGPAGDALSGGAKQHAGAVELTQPGALPELLIPMPPEFERPNVRIDDTDREWILIPGEFPGEYYLIEVDRTHTRLIGIQGDL